MKIAAIIEARMSSTRLPGKHLKLILGKPVLGLLIERITRVDLIDEIIITTTINEKDKIFEDLAKKNGVKCFRGSESDVLDRVLKAAQMVKADIIVETLGDCPLIDPAIITRCIKTFLIGDYDYVANALEQTFPNGFDVQVYPTQILKEVDKLTRDPLDREHVTRYIYNHSKKYKIKNIKAKGELYWPELAVTLDTNEDYKLIKIIFENLYPKKTDFNAYDVVRFLRKNPQLLNINKNIIRKAT